MRLRWAAEEAGLRYKVGTVPFEGRQTNHLDRQPFGQVPFLTDGEISIFESGACLLHLARKSDLLMPRNANGEAETIQWVIAALNSIEMVTVRLTASNPVARRLADCRHIVASPASVQAAASL